MDLVFTVLCVCLDLTPFGHGLHLAILSVPALTITCFPTWTLYIGSVVAANDHQNVFENG